MKIYSFFLFIIFYEITPESFAQKSSYESKFESRPFYTPNREEQSDAEFSRELKEKLSGNDYSKNKYQANDLEDQPLVSYDKEKILKRNAINNNYGMRGYDRVYKREVRAQPYRADEGYGIVYGNGRPVGILEPYPQAFEFEPWMNARDSFRDMQPQQLVHSRQYADSNYYPNGRIDGDLEKSENDLEDSAKFANERFPSIYNDFKINSGMYKGNNQPIRRASSDNLNIETNLIENNKAPEKSSPNLGETVKNENEVGDVKLQETKRSGSSITDEQVEQLKTTLSRIQNPGPSDSVEEIERNLRSILSDMGLVSEDEKESGKDKRNVDNSLLNVAKADKEDENLEEGANKIELVPNQAQPIDRNKRDNKNQVKQGGGESLDAPLFKRLEPKVKEETFMEDAPKLDSQIASNRIKKDSNKEVVKVANYKNEGDAFIRSKRQQDGKAEPNDLMKGLEKSGDLTVSGNKSPLASSENDAEIQEKRDKITTSHTAAINKREQDELEYQKHVEQIIQAKIDAIKEQVKREIEAINSVEVTTKCQDSQRRKRDISNTLIDGETRELDPQTHPDEKLLPLVRRRRYLDELPNLKRVKRGLLDFSNLKNIDSGDYLEMDHENREQRRAFPDYQFDPQENKMLPENVKTNQKLANARNILMDLTANENELLNVNSQDDASMQGEPLKIKVRSVTESDLPVGTVDPHSVTSQEINQKVENLAPEQQEGLKESNNLVLDSHSLQENSRIEDELLRSEHEHSLSDKRSVDNAVQSEDQKSFESQNIEKKAEKPGTLDDAQKTGLDPTFSQKEEDLLKKSEVAIDPSKDTENQDQDKKREVTSAKIEKSEGSVGGKAENKKEEENRMTRKRRQAEEEMMRQPLSKFRRIKRANDLISGQNVAYFPYRSDNVEVDDEGDEFDDDSLDDRTMEKRQANYDPNINAKFRRSLDYQNADEYVVPAEYSNYRPQRKRSLSEQYDGYENSANNYFYQPEPYVRRKRQDLDNTVSFRNGAGMLHHIAAIRDRNVQLQENERNKRTFKHSKVKLAPKETQNSIADFSDEDLFGALPQNYDGELSRFKRVKRTPEHVVEKG